MNEAKRRAAFEQWACEEPQKGPSLAIGCDGLYRDSLVLAWWQSWQAALASQQPAGVGDKPPCCDRHSKPHKTIQKILDRQDWPGGMVQKFSAMQALCERWANYAENSDETVLFLSEERKRLEAALAAIPPAPCVLGDNRKPIVGSGVVHSWLAGMEAVLCDPEGEPVFSGSDGDRAVVRNIMQHMRALLAAQQTGDAKATPEGDAELSRLRKANAVLREGLQRIAEPRDCGCVPCRGQCTSRDNLIIECGNIRDTAVEYFKAADKLKASME